MLKLMIFVSLIAPPRPLPTRPHEPAAPIAVAQPYQCMVGIEFVNGAPVLELVCE